MTLHNYTGSGTAALLTTGPWGLAVITNQNGAFQSPCMQSAGTVFSGWRFDSRQDHFGPSGSFNGSSTDSVLITSGWVLAVLKVAGSTLNAIAAAGNRTTLSGPEIGAGNATVQFPLDTGVLRYGPVDNFDGDGRHSVLAVNANEVATLWVLNGAFTARAIISFNTPKAGGWQATPDYWFGSVGDSGPTIGKYPMRRRIGIITRDHGPLWASQNQGTEMTDSRHKEHPRVCIIQIARATEG